MRLLIIGSTHGPILTAAKIAKDKGAAVAHVTGVDAALEQLRDGQGADLAFVELGQDIPRLCAQLHSEHIHLAIVACGVEPDKDAAVAAVKAGAKEFLPLPPDADLIAALLESVSDDDKPFIYESPAMTKLVAIADQVAPTDAGVMITGESGTGKEVIARYLHDRSKRRDGLFVSVNCAAIPENLLESELFGHEKGAFTGAVARRVGKFEEASGGTLLLDEISEMDLRLQAKLLRAIQERVIDRVGGSQPVKVNLRILATSNRDLREAVREGVFREDLLFRLNVINLHLPPLRERPEDIPPLARHFAAKYAASNGLPDKDFTPEALEKLRNYRWPGNVRELENTLHRAVIMAAGDVIRAEDIWLSDDMALGGTAAPSSCGTPQASSQDLDPQASSYTDAASDAQSAARDLVGRTVADVEQSLILDTLDHCLGNRTHAANILGISIRTLRNKLNQYADAGTAVPEAKEAG